MITARQEPLTFAVWELLMSALDTKPVPVSPHVAATKISQEEAGEPLLEPEELVARPTIALPRDMSKLSTERQSALLGLTGLRTRLPLIHQDDEPIVCDFDGAIETGLDLSDGFNQRPNESESQTNVIKMVDLVAAALATPTRRAG